MRKEYEGHAVPDLPTSHGENRWVLPAPFARVPDEQLTDPQTRRRKLFDHRPAEQMLSDRARAVLETSLDDLADTTPSAAAELRELGMALYLDRPLGLFKEPAEVDRTPLLSYEAFSLAIAESRLKKLFAKQDISQLLTRLQAAAANCGGLPVSQFTSARRLGSVALEDARLASADFQFLRTTPVSLRQFLAHFDLSPLEARFPAVAEWLHTSQHILAIRDPHPPALDATATATLTKPVLTLFDQHLQPRMVLGIELPTYIETAGVELPTTGLLVLSDPHPVRLLPRRDDPT
jgi:hypothetical protein